MTDRRVRHAWRRCRRHVKWGALVGLALAIICHFLPHDYRAVCDAVASCLP